MRRRVLLSLAVALALVAVAGLVVVLVRPGAGARTTAGVSVFADHPPVHYGGVVPGQKTLPPEPTTPDGVPALLSGGPARDAYLQQMADHLDVSTAPPPRSVGFFGRVQSASSTALTMTPDRPSTASPNAVASTVVPAVGADGATVRVMLTPQTVEWLSASPAKLHTGAELFAGGELAGNDLQARLVADTEHLRTPPGSSQWQQPTATTSGTALPDPGAPAGDPGTEAVAWQAGQQRVVAAAAGAPVALSTGAGSGPGSGDPANGADTVILSDRAGLGNIDPHFKAEVGDENSCYAKVEAEFLLSADYEVHWPFQFHTDGDGFTVEAQDRTPEAGGGFAIEATAFSDSEEYSVYSGWGLALGADIGLGCHVSVGPFSGDVDFSLGVSKWSFDWVNETKRHIPLSGQTDLVVPPDTCPLVGLSAGPLTLGIGACQWQTYSGGLFRATLQGAGGTPQGIAMPYAGHDVVQPQTAPSGGPVTVSQFDYAATETTRMTAGVVADITLNKIKKPKGGKKGKEDSDPESVSGSYRSAQRHPDQKGPTTPSGAWQDGQGNWHASDGSPAETPSAADIQAGNANWIHPGQVGPTLADGVWQHKDGRWRTPDGRFTSKPTGEAPNTATAEGDKETEPDGEESDSTTDIHGWDYQQTAPAAFQPTEALPGTLTLDLPIAPAGPSPSPTPSPGWACTATTFEQVLANPNETEVSPAGQPRCLDGYAEMNFDNPAGQAAPFFFVFSAGKWSLIEGGNAIPTTACTVIPQQVMSAWGYNCSGSATNGTAGSGVAPGHGSPAAAVAGLLASEVAGDWSASTGACSYVQPDAQSTCAALEGGNPAASGQYQIGATDTQGTEALVEVTGVFSAPGSPTLSNSDPTSGMPGSSADFQTVFDSLVGNADSVLSPEPCIELNGQWYADIGG